MNHKSSESHTPSTSPTPEPQPPFPPQHQDSPGIEDEMQPRPRYQARDYIACGKLARKVALITGGDSGIGRAVAVLFAREGANVAIVYLPEEQRDADIVAEAVRAEGRKVLQIPGNVTDSLFCQEAVKQTIDELGQLDILVNNAAFQKHHDKLEDVTDDQWEWTFRVNVFGYFAMTKAAVKHIPRGGTIINTGSITGLEGSKKLLDYSATKGAIHAFTKSLAQNLLERGIRVNCIAPGPVWTPLNVQDREAKEVSKFGSDTEMGRPAQPEEIAPAYVYFASAADSSYVTGEVFTLLGGDTRAA